MKESELINLVRRLEIIFNQEVVMDSTKPHF